MSAEKPRVLAVDDDADSLEIVRAALTTLGVAELRLLTDSTEAVGEAERLQPELVILDWMMPAPDGLELTRLLRAAPAPLGETRIVLLSAYSERWRIEAARDAGVDAFLAKPIAVRALAKRLRLTLDAPRHFLKIEGYAGPDRRRRSQPFEGADRRGPPPPGAPALQAELERRLARLAEAFPAQLAKVLDRLQALAAELNGSRAPRALAETQRLLHDLSGQAGNFGHGEVGRIARRMETALATTGDAARRRALLVRGRTLLAEAAGLAAPQGDGPPPAERRG